MPTIILMFITSFEKLFFILFFWKSCNIIITRFRKKKKLGRRATNGDPMEGRLWWRRPLDGSSVEDNLGIIKDRKSNWTSVLDSHVWTYVYRLLLPASPFLLLEPPKTPKQIKLPLQPPTKRHCAQPPPNTTSTHKHHHPTPPLATLTQGRRGKRSQTQKKGVERDRFQKCLF